MAAPATEHLTEAEMIEILEDLARNSASATARIQAIKTLREMRGERPAEDTVRGLYDVANPGRIRTKAA